MDSPRRFAALVFALASAPLIAAPKPATDTFEEIAKQKLAEVPGLVAHPEAKLPETLLPWDDKPGAAFAPGEKITTQAQLDAELARMRGKYAPFLRDLAPAIAARPQKELFEFSWRLAAGKDAAAELADALAGKGEWKSVKIPHYAGPTGKAASFYRTEVEIGGDLLSRDNLFLHFNNVDYYADIYVNGTLVGKHEGLFDAFEFDIRPLVKPGKNVILVKVGNDGCPIGTTNIHKGGNFDFGPKMAASGGPGWDDPEKGWVCTPVGFGLWQRCHLEARSAAFINDVFVRPLAGLDTAEVWVEVGGLSADAKNLGDLTVAYSLYGQNFEAKFAEAVAVEAKLEPGEVDLFATPQPAAAAARRHAVRLFKFTVAVPEARIWNTDTPWLYQMQVALAKDGKTTDAFRRQFGMKSFVHSATSVPKGRFYLNGKEVRLRGANMMGNLMQCVIRRDDRQLVDDILLAKIANMNFWRMTQQPCQDEVVDAFDKLGLMSQSDLPTFHFIPASQYDETLREAGAQLRLVRGHACNAMVSYINEPMNGTRGGQKRIPEKEMVELFRKCDALIPAVAPDQQRKWVDGDYQNLSEGYSDHHCYNLWYWKHAIPFNRQYKGAWVKTRAGWMHGCGEYGSEGVDSPELIKKYYPKAWQGVVKNGKWSPEGIPVQAIRPTFARWMRPYTTLEEWCANSRDHQRDSDRLVVEALRRDPLMNSTAIHLLIDAWPAGWCKTVMDYDRKAKPAYFAFRDAQTPLAVNLRPDRFYAYPGENYKVGAWVCNDTQDVPAGATLRYVVEDAGKVVASGTAKAKITACEPEFQGWLSFPAPATDARRKLTLRTGLFDAEGRLLHDSSVELELLPAALKGAKPKDAGGWMQFLIES